ncbi:MAG TPA: DUF3455 domain-containing protein [Candidatus Angelobacter sp.]|jgi:hypothetical protein|nr:DUF3455 domain-containing protein [Candidatus Angelobacter sp.]
MEQRQVPNAIEAPADCRLAFQVSAKGVQVYRLVKDQQRVVSWVLAGPEAELTDENARVVGTHFEGPTWRHHDGSEIRGKVIARADAPDPAAIPWLLLEVTERAGTGALSRVSYIQRVETFGGHPPQKHDVNEGEFVRIPYTAVYRFFSHFRS